jgi:transcriptional regulator with XRE-family HTH domain
VKVDPLLAQERVIRVVLDTVPSDVLGARLRRERLIQGISIRDLATKAQVGKSSIVRLESGQSGRPITLLKICAALGLHPERLAQGGGSESVGVHRRADDRWYELEDFGAGTLGDLDRSLTREERKELRQNGAKNPILLLRSRLGDGKLLPTIIEAYEPSEVRAHPGEEFVFVLRGYARVTVNGVPFDLAAGESINFWGNEPHSYAPLNGQPALMLSIRVNP